MHTIEELHAHYMAVRRRLNTAPVKHKPKPQVKIIDIREAAEKAEQRRKEAALAEEKAAIQRIYGDFLVGPSKYRQKIMEVAKKHEMGVEQMLGLSRKQSFVNARHEAMYELHLMGLSLPMIGRMMGRRDHTTVLHGIRRYKKILGAQKNTEGS